MAGFEGVAKEQNHALEPEAEQVNSVLKTVVFQHNILIANSNLG